MRSNGVVRVCSMCWRCRPRIVWPRMPRVAAAKFLADFLVGRGPEALEVLRGLHRPRVRRQQVKRNRRLLRAEPRRLGEPKELLQLHGDRDRAVAAYSSRIDRPLGTVSVSGASRSMACLTAHGQVRGNVEVLEALRADAATSPGPADRASGRQTPRAAPVVPSPRRDRDPARPARAMAPPSPDRRARAVRAGPARRTTRWRARARRRWSASML